MRLQIDALKAAESSQSRTIVRLCFLHLLPLDYCVTRHPETQVLFEYCAAFTPQFLPMMVRLGMLAPRKPCALLVPDTVLLRTMLVE
jgi:hypothetical protein